MNSDKTIRVGDLVMVVRGTPCCGHIPPWMGAPWKVERILRVRRPFPVSCFACQSFLYLDVYADNGTGENVKGGFLPC
jgi:hypothetical protein